MSAALRPERDERPAPPTLADLSHQRRWVGWRAETANGRVTKVPKIANGPRAGKPASSTDPATWTTRDRAEAWDRGAAGKGGVGVVLGDLDEPGGGYVLCGVDLDTCRDPASSVLKPWAARVIARLGSYAEISPSDTGVKVFFLVAPDDLHDLRRLMQELGSAKSKLSRSWKWSGNGHPPAIEFYRGDRYFAVTGRPIDDAHGELSVVSLDAVRGLFEEDGPAFEALDPATASSPLGPAAGSQSKRTGQRDGSRSAVAFGLAVKAIRAGKTKEQWIKAGRKEQAAKSWFEEADPRQLDRAWDNARSEIEGEIAETQRSGEEIVERFNERYAVVNDDGRTVVFETSRDHALKRDRFVRIATEDLEKLYRNKRVLVSRADGRPVERSEAQIWLDHPGRKQFIGGVTFAPGASVPADVLNLWRGFAVEPVPGDWGLLREHIRLIACRGDETLFTYLMGWMAALVQRPGELPGVAIILQGKKGCGKGTIAHALLRVFGQHGMAIRSAHQLAGQFTGHLRDVVFLFTDEACFSDDPKTLGSLNAMITEPEVTLEAKGRDAISVPNFLHHMMASNERVVVPMGEDERRYLVLPCDEVYSRGGERANEARGYFDALRTQLENGGYAAMLHDLLQHDVSGFEVRNVPNSVGNREHVAASGSLAHRWLFEVLDRGYVLRSQHGHETTFHRWMDDVASELLFASFEAYAREQRARRDLTREQLGKFLDNVGYIKKVRPRGRVLCDEGRTGPLEKERAHQRRLGTLDEARQIYASHMGITPPTEWVEVEDNDDPPRSGPSPALGTVTGNDPY